MSPSKTRRQQRLFGADYARAKAGKKTRTGMSKAKLREMAHKPKGGYPKKKR